MRAKQCGSAESWKTACRLGLVLVVLTLGADVILSAQSQRGLPGMSQRVAADPGATKTTVDKSGRDVTAAHPRDPFKLPAPLPPEAREARRLFNGPRPAGKRGLIIGELKIEGVVRQKGDSAGSAPVMIAVVSSAAEVTFPKTWSAAEFVISKCH